MLQKMVAMGCSIENWNDMRRFNFSAGNIGDFGVVYPGYGRGPLFAGQAQVTGTNPTICSTGFVVSVYPQLWS